MPGVLKAYVSGAWVPVGVGPAGPQGPPGPSGVGSSFTFVQSTPLAVWVITHSVPYYPNVVVIDSANVQVEGDVVYTSSSVVTITFSGAFSGRAFLS